MSNARVAYVTVAPDVTVTFHAPDGTEHTVTADKPYVATEAWQTAFLSSCPSVKPADTKKPIKAEED